VRRHALCFLAGLAFIAASVAAQEPDRGPDASASTHVPGIILLAIPGKPFSGIDNIEWTRTLADGSTITTHTTAKLARDSYGRVYRENHRFAPLDKPSPRYQIHIYDPVNHSQISCSTTAFRCVITNYLPQTFFKTMPTGSFDNGNRFLARENLGPQVIEGIYTNGTLETVTINPGVLGNDSPLVSTPEFWYSGELEINLSVTRIDPREGKQVIWISNLSLAEQDAHLFDIPPGYTVRDLRSSAGIEGKRGADGP
jgi:hypothetical protein